MQDVSNYQKIREDTKSFYDKIGRLRCPALQNDFVHFTAEGFNHLIYKGKRSERDKSVQVMKFKLIPNAKEVIVISTTYQEYDESVTQIKRKRRKKIIQEPATVRYWGFVAIVRGMRVKTIVRQVGNGQKHFWSVIPAWGTNQYRGMRLFNKSKGNLSED